MREKPITINGKTKNVSAWLKEYGVSKEAYRKRLKKGMTEVEAITTEKRDCHIKLITIDGKTKPLASWLAEYGLYRASYYERLKKGMTEVEAITSAKRNYERREYVVTLTTDEIAYLSRRHRNTVSTLLKRGVPPHQILMTPRNSRTNAVQNRISDELSAFGIVY